MQTNKFFTAMILFAVIVTYGFSYKSSHQKSIILTNGKSDNWLMVKRSEMRGSLSEASTKNYNTEGWMHAIVPGTVLNSLVNDKVFPEPYFGLNNKISENLIPDISNVGREYYHYVFRKEFQLPDEMKNKNLWIKFHGINYIADIWLNGRNIEKIKGMFETRTINITNDVNFDKANVLLVDVEPVENPGKPKASLNKANVVVKENKNGGDGEIGRDVTMLMSVGWDFTFPDGIRDRNTGIWRNIEIYSTGSIDLRNVFVKTDLNLPDTTSSYQTVSVDLVNTTGENQKGTIEVSIPQYNVSISKHIEIVPQADSTFMFSYNDYQSLVFKNPKLWWPFNQGEQNLSPILIKFIGEDGEVSDIEKTSFGIRKITSDLNTPDSSRMFYLNGRRFFVRGSNWIPEAMLRTSKLRTKTELEYTKQAGINFLRLWGGGISESDYFFSLCDSLGILVWHEFWMTGDTQMPDDHELYKQNVISTVQRIRNHPSLAYYVSSNEKKDIIEIKPILDKLDGTRGYQPESECCGVHDGSPYKYENPMQYYDNTVSDRGSRIDGFCPEYGTPCLPTLEFLQGIMNKKDIYPPNKKVWNYLDGNGFHNMTTKYLNAISQYGKPGSIKDFVAKGEMVGAIVYKALWECWNYNKFEYGDRFASGVLFWYHNSPIKQVCGRMWDWSLEPTAALYSVKNALEPLHKQFDYIKNTVSIINEYPRNFNDLNAEAEIYDFSSKLVYEKKDSLNISAGEVINDLFKINFPSSITQVHFIALYLKDKNNRVISKNFYWRSKDKYAGPWTTTGPAYSGFEKINELPKTKVDINVKKESPEKLIVTAFNKGKNIAFFVRLKVLDKDNKLVRRVIYEDNYFSLLPNGSKNIEINLELTGLKSEGVNIDVEGFNI
jgi:mannosylglycoprotein endo-beta-mannosidase